MRKIKKDDLVKVIAGKDKDKTGKVLSVKDGKVLVEGCNMVTKHSCTLAASMAGSGFSWPSTVFCCSAV